jgi:membrane protease YdiL (CAAX protease family)
MTPSKRILLPLSLGLIGLHWAYTLLDHPLTPVIPPTFAELAVKIILNKVILFTILAVLLSWEPDGWQGVGVSAKDWPKHLAIGIGIGFVMFITLNVALTAALESVLPRPAQNGPSVLAYFADLKNLLVWLPIGVFGGGVVEELERAFILTRFVQWQGRPGLVLAIILSSAMFGLGHLYQGPGVAISTAVSGLVFTLVFLRRRSALEAISAHAFTDILGMVGGAMMAHHP